MTNGLELLRVLDGEVGFVLGSSKSESSSRPSNARTLLRGVSSTFVDGDGGSEAKLEAILGEAGGLSIVHRLYDDRI